MAKKINIEIGSRFGRLTVIKESFSLNDETYLPCICDCGKAANVRSSHLRVGKTKSCGCLNREISSKTNTTHGMAAGSFRKSRPEYRVWNGMIQRCHNPRNNHYENYGGRGIAVCEEWRESFEAFFADMGKRADGLTLDRIDNDKGYLKENCRWATRKEQQNNLRKNVRVEYQGQTKTLTEWAEALGIERQNLYSRIARGWEASRAFTTPTNHKFGRKITGTDEPAKTEW